MANLFKPTYTKTDPKSGKRVTRKSRKWYGQFRDTSGTVRRIPLCTDKAAALAMLQQAIRKAERLDAGIVDPFDESSKRPLSDHLADYRRYLESKGNSAKHVDQTIDHIEKVIAGCGFRRLADLNATPVSDYLQSLRTARRFKVKYEVGSDLRKEWASQDRIRVTNESANDRAEVLMNGKWYSATILAVQDGKSARTFNSYLTAIQSLCRWMVKDRRMHSNPLSHLSRLNLATDRRRNRRALTSEEFAKLVNAAQTGPEVEGVSGSERAMLYIVACWTGLRRAELASLTRRSFILDGESPSVTVKAAYSKRRRTDTIPLHPGVAERLQAWFDSRGDKGESLPVFSLRTEAGSLRDTACMMRKDLLRAGIAYRGEDGFYVDFHANRHTFISNLSRSGASPKVAQTLARHSDINLTMQTYTHLGIHDQLAAVADLPAPPPLNPSEPANDVLPATGTDGRLARGLVEKAVAFSPGVAESGKTGEAQKQSDAATEGQTRAKFSVARLPLSPADKIRHQWYGHGGGRSLNQRVDGSSPSGGTARL